MTEKTGKRIEDRKIDLSKQLELRMDGLYLAMNPGQKWNKQTKEGTYDPKRRGNVFLAQGQSRLRISYSQFAAILVFGQHNRDFIRSYVDIEDAERETSRQQLEEAKKL